MLLKAFWDSDGVVMLIIGGLFLVIGLAHPVAAIIGGAVIVIWLIAFVLTLRHPQR